MATPTPPPKPSEPSYTAMETADVEAIGAHCQMPFCHQLDFLPFRCDSCHLTFCLDHRSETSHKCAHEGEWARNRRLKQLGASNTTSTDSLPSKPTLLTAQQCGEPQCKTFINTTQSQAIHCQTCNRQYCLKHRFQEDHDCKNLIPVGARPKVNQQSNSDKIRLGFGKLKSWGKDKQDSILPKPKPTSKAIQIANLNKLKQSAKGDAKIPSEKRTYLHVEAEASMGTSTTSAPKKDLFFNKDWPVGRLLDEAAKKLGVENLNNITQAEDGRLRVYHVESGRVLKFSEKVGEAMASGNTVVLLRGVGDPEGSGTPS